MDTTSPSPPSVDRAASEQRSADTAHLLQIGDVAKESGLTLRTLRYYEEIGLIEPYHRTKGNFRLYHPSVVTRVEFISSLKRLDFSLDEIREVLGPIEGWSNEESVIAHSIRALKAKQQKIDEKLQELHDMGQEVKASLSKLEEECFSCKSQEPDVPCDPKCHNKQYHLN